jgi:nicotinamidase/pyrazinamidase
MSKTLLIVDLQNDFLHRGALPVKDADAVIPTINKMIPFFEHIIVSQDWHPKNHVSFAKTHGKRPGEWIKINGKKQRLWPEHCVQKTLGAELASSLDKSRIEFIAYKGKDARFDSYSIFFDDAGKSTHLFEYLTDKNLFDLYFVGVATDYCVKSSVLDALCLGFNVSVIEDGCRAVGFATRSLEEMKKKGARILESEEILGGSV